MPTHFHGSAPLLKKLGDVWIATPQVMAMRLSRMALAGHNPSARDRAEMRLMVDEKLAAATQAWFAMWVNWCFMPMRLAPAMASALGGGSQRSLQQAAARAVTASLTAGVMPVRRTVMANARRLARPAPRRPR